MKGDNKSFWQNYAKLYGPLMKISGKGFYRELCDCIARDLSGDEQVLELACGTGQLTFPLCDKVGSYVATDFSENMVAEARRLYGKLRRNDADNMRGGLTFEVQDATALTYPDNSFDVVIIANALHIMPDPESALRQIRRVLRPGGVLYAPTFVQREGKAFKPWIRLISLFGFKTFNRWSAADFAAKVESQGFSVVGSSLMDAGISPLLRLKAIARKPLGPTQRESTASDPRPAM